MASSRAVVGWLAVVALIGLTLRSNMGTVPPLVDVIADDLDLSSTVSGLLTSAAAFCTGLFAPLAPRLARKLGLEAALSACFALLAVVLLTRAWLPDGSLLLLNVTLAGLAMSGPTALAPALIGARLGSRRGTATGVFSGGLAIGITTAGAAAVPLAGWWGWRAALAVWAVPAAVTAVALAVASRRSVRPPPGTGTLRLPWRERRALKVAWFSVAVVTMGFSGLAWISSYFVSLGYSHDAAAHRFVAFQSVQLLAMVTLPMLCDVTRDRRPLMALTVVAAMTGAFALLVAPDQLGFVGAALWGIGVGGGSAIGIVLIGDHAGTPLEAVRIGSLTFMAAYCAGAVGPVAIGWTIDRTGGYSLGFGGVVLLGALALASVPRYRPVS